MITIGEITMDIREILGRRILFFDGGMGTMLQKYGMKAGGLPELLNITDRGYNNGAYSKLGKNKKAA